MLSLIKKQSPITIQLMANNLVWARMQQREVDKYIYKNMKEKQAGGMGFKSHLSSWLKVNEKNSQSSEFHGAGYMGITISVFCSGHQNA